MSYRLAETFRVAHRGKQYLFVVKNAAIVELDPGLNVLLSRLSDAASRDPGGLSEEVVREQASAAIEADADEALDDLIQLQLFEPIGSARHDAFVALNRVLGQNAVRPVPLQSLVAHVTQDCNLRCGYCYADHGLYGATDRTLMSEEKARSYVDLLLDSSGDEKSLHLTFFGGEPLMNFPAIRAAVAYGRERAADCGKRLSFSITTNGTLFDREKIEFVLENDIQVTVSLDGPPEIHDAVRPRAGGSGSYAATMARVRPLLAQRRVPARVTLTRRCLEVERIVDHLLSEGFSEVGVTPAATLHPELKLTGSDWDRLGDALEYLGARFESEALAGRRYGFTNVINLIRQFADGASRGYPCGAGAGLLAGNASGELYACHRNVHDPRFALGSLSEGIDRERQRDLLGRLHVSQKPDCDSCWLKSLCAGGCYHVGAMLGGGAASVPRALCDHIRRWYLGCLKIYLTLLDERPDMVPGAENGNGAALAAAGGTRDPHLNPFLE